MVEDLMLMNTRPGFKFGPCSYLQRIHHIFDYSYKFGKCTKEGKEVQLRDFEEINRLKVRNALFMKSKLTGENP